MNQEFDKVKRLFLKPFRPKSTQQTPPIAQPASVAHTTGLQPRFVVPPVPHPCPHEQLALVASSDGLLLRPYLNARTAPESYVRIAWGKDPLVEEIKDGGDIEGVDWSEAAMVYGIVGMLNLFTGTVYSFNSVLLAGR